MTELSTDRAPAADKFSPRRRTTTYVPQGLFCVIGIIGALAMGSSTAAAKDKSQLKAELKKQIEHVPKEPFGKIPKGPLQIVISVDQQKLHLYSDGAHVADTLVATGVTDHPTPLGIFSIIGKELYHESNIYSSAPMPYMQRITWSGVAIHQGVGLGHPASHGCIRVPREFAQRLWVLTRLGARVIIARPELKPQEIADPHLFVHNDKPSVPTAAVPTAVEAAMTAQIIDSNKATDILAPSVVPELRGGISTEVPPPVSAAPRGASVGFAGVDRPAPGVGLATKQLIGPAPLYGKPEATREAALESMPIPPPKPHDMAASNKGRPIAIFISRKTSKIYVRQNFAPLFESAIAIEHPNQPLGTHVFTAMQYMRDGATLRWTVVSLPGDQPNARRNEEIKSERNARQKRTGGRTAKAIVDAPPAPPPQTPQQALARIEIPADVIDQLSALIVPGSSLIVSDQGLGEETGEGTDFVLVTSVETATPLPAKKDARPRLGRRVDNTSRREERAHSPRQPISLAPER